MEPGDVKQKLIEAGRVLAHLGHGDMTRGHISVRVPGEAGLFYMKAHGLGLDEITLGNILTLNLEGEVTAGNARRHSEVFIHSEIFRARPDVAAVVHTHSTHIVAFSATGRAMRPYSQGGAAFTGALPVYTGSIDLIRSAAMGRDVAMALGPHRAVLLRNHGVVMTGGSLDEAVVLLTMLETAAQIQLMVDAVRGDAPEFDPGEVEKLREKLLEARQFPVNFEYLVRRARRERGLGAD